MPNHQGEATNEINVNQALRRGQAEVKFSFSSTTYFFRSFHQNLIRIPNLHFLLLLFSVRLCTAPWTITH